jgi:hypothetical protein
MEKLIRNLAVKKHRQTNEKREDLLYLCRYRLPHSSSFIRISEVAHESNYPTNHSDTDILLAESLLKIHPFRFPHLIEQCTDLGW